jgi:hypothetical protein
MNIDEFKVRQAEFIDKLVNMKKDMTENEKARKDFIKRFSIEFISKMTLDDYVVGKHNMGSFCNGLETGLMKLGKIKGGTTADKKFGVYYSQENGKYVSIGKYNKNPDKAFVIIKQEILNLINAGSQNDIAGIKINLMSPMFKGKILSTYYPDKYLNVFSEQHLDHFLMQFGLYYSKDNDIIDKREILLGFKNQDEVMKNWSIAEFGKFLYSEFKPPENLKVVNRNLKDYVDAQQDYAPLYRIKPIEISIDIDDKAVSDNSGNSIGNAKRRKIDFAKENAIRKKLGNRGEQIVFDFERTNLQKQGKKDLADKVTWSSQTDDSLGYDILSYEIDGKEKYIEVKSTTNKSGNDFSFTLSNNQYKKAKSLGNYYFYIVFEANGKRPNIWKVINLFNYEDKGVFLTPQTYRVDVKVK